MLDRSLYWYFPTISTVHIIILINVTVDIDNDESINDSVAEFFFENFIFPLEIRLITYFMDSVSEETRLWEHFANRFQFLCFVDFVFILSRFEFQRTSAQHHSPSILNWVCVTVRCTFSFFFGDSNKIKQRMTWCLTLLLDCGWIQWASLDMDEMIWCKQIIMIVLLLLFYLCRHPADGILPCMGCFWKVFSTLCR